MSNKKDVHYNLDPIDKKQAIYNLIFGERSNGKSYQLKYKKMIIKYLNTGKRFILMRRWREEITSEKIEQYFQDVDVEKLTAGEYNCIDIYKKAVYLAKYDNELMKIKRGEKVGYIVALSTEQNYAGASYLDVEDIIFEEFMSRGVYLHREPDKLMNFYATVDRKRLTTRLWLVGNSISRVCPYINEWGLFDIFRNIKQGEIKTHTISCENDSGEIENITIAIEYCRSSGKSSGTIGNNSAMINTGAWETQPQPHLPKSYNDYTCIFKIGFQYKNFKFLGELLKDNESSDICWFVKPYSKEFKDDILVFSDTIKTSFYWQKDIYNLVFRRKVNQKLQEVLQTFKESMIFYSDDLTGTDFKQAIDFVIRK